MRREIHELIEASRALGIRLTGKPAPGSIRISGGTGDFVERLERLQRALEAVDASGAASETEAADGSVDDSLKLRKALDGLLRFIQVKGVNLAEADAIVRDALNLEGEEPSSKKGGSLPTFKPSKLKKKKAAYRVRLNVFPERPGEASLNDLKKIVHEVGLTEALLGATVAKNEAPLRRAERKTPVGIFRPGR